MDGCRNQKNSSVKLACAEAQFFSHGPNVLKIRKIVKVFGHFEVRIRDGAEGFLRKRFWEKIR
jgi:hypothetical protein